MKKEWVNYGRIGHSTIDRRRRCRNESRGTAAATKTDNLLDYIREHQEHLEHPEQCISRRRTLHLYKPIILFYLAVTHNGIAAYTSQVNGRLQFVEDLQANYSILVNVTAIYSHRLGNAQLEARLVDAPTSRRECLSGVAQCRSWVGQLCDTCTCRCLKYM